MKRLILHVGHSKCASSTVQSFLSLYPDHALADGRGMLRYVAIVRDGRMLHSDALTTFAAMQARRYCNTTSRFLSDPALFASGWQQIADFAGPDDTILISCEGWAYHSFLTPEVVANIGRLPLRPDVFFLTRPPVDWVNAAWWQWGVWEDRTLQDALAQYAGINFLESVQHWEAVENIGTLGLFDISQGPLESLARFARLELDGPIEFESVNTATDYDLLRHLARHPSIYQRTKSSPQTEFLLNHLVKADRRPLPFVVPRHMAHDILERTQQDNRALIGRLSANGRPMPPEVARKYVDPTAYDHLSDDDVLGDFDSDYADAFVGKLVQTLLSLAEVTERQRTMEEAMQSFDPDAYLTANPDVAAAGKNPFEHFVRFGFKEGRPLYI